MANDGSLLGQSGEIKKAIESIASNIVEENTRSCFRIVKAKVTTAINSGKIGVKVPPNDLELFLPYSSACNNLAVGDLCWVALIFSSWKNAIVWQPIKFDGTGGGGGNINIINTGTGNAITSITANGLDLTVDKGASFQPLHTYLTQISSLANNLTGLIKLTNGTISLDSTSYATTADLAKKVNDMTIGLYNGNAGNPKPIKFMSVNYSDCDSNNGVFVKVSMVSGHGNGVSYTFLQDATFNVSYNGTVSVEMFKYFGSSVTYNSVTRQYGDIFYVIDTVNKVVDFYCLMGQYSTMYQSPYKKLNSSSKGTITQYTTATVYSSGTQVFASGGDIVVKPDLAAYQPINANLTSISNLATNITGLIKMTNGVASLDTNSYATTTQLNDYFPKSGGALNEGANILLNGSNPYVGFLETNQTQYYIQGYQGEFGMSVGGSWGTKRISIDSNGKVIIPSKTLGDGSSYTYTLPNKTGTIALTSDLANYIPLAGSSAITGDLIPNTDYGISLGSPTKRWGGVYTGSLIVGSIGSDLIPYTSAALDLGSNTFRWRNLYVQNGILNYGEISQRGVDANSNYAGYFLIGYISTTNCYAPVNAEIESYDWDTEEAYYKGQLSAYFGFSNNVKTLSGHIGAVESGGNRTTANYSYYDLYLVCRTTNTSSTSGTNRVEIWYHQRGQYERRTFKFNNDFGYIRANDRTLWTKVKVASGTDQGYVSAGNIVYLDSSNQFPTFIPESSWGVSVFQTASYPTASIFNNNLNNYVRAKYGQFYQLSDYSSNYYYTMPSANGTLALTSGENMDGMTKVALTRVNVKINDYGGCWYMKYGKLVILNISDMAVSSTISSTGGDDKLFSGAPRAKFSITFPVNATNVAGTDGSYCPRLMIGADGNVYLHYSTITSGHQYCGQYVYIEA